MEIISKIDKIKNFNYFKRRNLKKKEGEKLALSFKNKIEIWQIIFERKGEDDPPPEKVIQERFNGDVEAYLFEMARWHKVPLSVKVETKEGKNQIRCLYCKTLHSGKKIKKGNIIVCRCGLWLKVV